MMRRYGTAGILMIFLSLLTLCLWAGSAGAAPETAAHPDVMKWAFLSAAIVCQELAFIPIIRQSQFDLQGQRTEDCVR